MADAGNETYFAFNRRVELVGQEQVANAII